MINQTTVDVAELARLRAIEEAAMKWGDAKRGSPAMIEAGRELATALLLLYPSEPDSPPSPLDTDEQISRLLRENELLASRMLEANDEVAAAHNQLSAIRSVLDRFSSLTVPAFLKGHLAAK